MTLKNNIRDEKMQYNEDREAGKLWPLLCGKIDKDEYLTCEEILHSDQKRVIEQGKFKYSPLGKAFKKQTKTIGDQGKNK